MIDSRGTTSRNLSDVKNAGAVEVHFRVSSPPYSTPATLG